MSRLYQLDHLLFPVETHPVFVEIGDLTQRYRVRATGKKAIVNMANKRVLNLVGPSYRMVTNKEALDWAYQCCKAVFPETQQDEWEVSGVNAPSTFGYCHIDLTHKTNALDFEYLMVGERPEVPEVFGPFIRVTNSYNGQRALNFNIGFHRKICKNGMVGPDVIVSFKFTHNKSDIGEAPKFDFERSRLDEMKKSFLEYFDVLRNFPVNKSQFSTLARAVLLLKQPESPDDQTDEDPKWVALQQHLNEMCERYATNLGENGYAVLNVITEFASQPLDNLYVRRDVHSLQKLTGEWLINFSERCQQTSFSLDEYLDELNNVTPTNQVESSEMVQGREVG